MRNYENDAKLLFIGMVGIMVTMFIIFIFDKC